MTAWLFLGLECCGTTGWIASMNNNEEHGRTSMVLIGEMLKAEWLHFVGVEWMEKGWLSEGGEWIACCDISGLVGSEKGRAGMAM